MKATVRFTPRSANRKFGPVGNLPTRKRPRMVPMKPYVSSTMVSIAATCPDSCVFKPKEGKPGGCFADAGFTRISMKQMDRAAVDLAGDEITDEEARQIESAYRGGPVPQDGHLGRGRDLRLHVGGDVASARGAARLGKAAENYRARGGGAVWTYTHRWREIPRAAWGPAISVLASVENERDILLARQAGYATAIVVEEFVDGPNSFYLRGISTKVTPCPAETLNRRCVDCRLCLDDQGLLSRNAAIAFRVHGPTATAAKAAIAEAAPEEGTR